MNQKFMKKLCLFIMIFVFILLAGGQLQAATDSAYQINNYDILVQLRDNSSADVTETISYQINQNLKSFEFTINYADAGNADLEKISVATPADGSAPTVFVEAQQADAADKTPLPMTYTAKDNGRSLQINLQVLSDKDTLRTVRISYKLSKLVVRHQDAAQLKHAFFNTAQQVPINMPSLAVKLPAALSALQFWNLPISLADFNYSQPQPDMLVYKTDFLTKGQNLKLVCLFPVTLFDGSAISSDGQTWEKLSALARKEDNNLHQLANIRSRIYTLIFILLGLSILLGLMIYWLFDRESTTSFRHRYWLDIPAECPPALMSVLRHKARPGKLILATLIDLVRRGELQLHGCVFSRPERSRKDYNGFATYEVYLLEWLFGRMTTDQTLSTAEIRRLARDPANAEQFHAYYRAFRQLVNEEMANRELIDQTRSQRGRLASLLTALFYLILTASGILYLQNAASLLLLIPVAGLTVYSFVLRRLTVSGREICSKGKALDRTFRQLASLKMPIEPDFIRQALPFAIATGSAGHLLDQILLLTEDRQQAFKTSLDDYGLTAINKSWPEQVKTLSEDLKVMESMLSASWLMSTGIHH